MYNLQLDSCTRIAADAVKLLETIHRLNVYQYNMDGLLAC